MNSFSYPDFGACNHTVLYQLCKRAGLQVKPTYSEHKLSKLLVSGKSNPTEIINPVDSWRIAMSHFVESRWSQLQNQIKCPLKDADGNFKQNACFDCVDGKVINCLIDNEQYKKLIEVFKDVEEPSPPTPITEDDMSTLDTKDTIIRSHEEISKVSRGKRYQIAMQIGYIQEGSQEAATYASAANDEQINQLLQGLNMYDSGQLQPQTPIQQPPAPPTATAQPPMQQPAPPMQQPAGQPQMPGMGVLGQPQMPAMATPAQPQMPAMQPGAAAVTSQPNGAVMPPPVQPQAMPMQQPMQQPPMQPMQQPPVQQTPVQQPLMQQPPMQQQQQQQQPQHPAQLQTPMQAPQVQPQQPPMQQPVQQPPMQPAQPQMAQPQAAPPAPMQQTRAPMTPSDPVNAGMQSTDIQIAELRKEVSDLKELVYGMGRILNTFALISLEAGAKTLGVDKPTLIAQVKAMSAANELENLLVQSETQGKG